MYSGNDPVSMHRLIYLIILGILKGQFVKTSLVLFGLWTDFLSNARRQQKAETSLGASKVTSVKQFSRFGKRILIDSQNMWKKLRTVRPNRTYFYSFYGNYKFPRVLFHSWVSSFCNNNVGANKMSMSLTSSVQEKILNTATKRDNNAVGTRKRRFNKSVKRT